MKEKATKKQTILRNKLIATGLLLPLNPLIASEFFYQVKKGDSLSKIAKKIPFPFGKLNKKEKFSLLIKVNPQIRDINLIYPNQKINLPVKSEVEDFYERKNGSKNSDFLEEKDFPEESNSYYTIKRGDTLSEIAQSFIGDPVFDKKSGSLIFLLRYNPHIANPDQIKIGTKIQLPPSAKISSRIPTSLTQKLSLTPIKYCSVDPKNSFVNLDFNKEYPFTEWKNALEKDEEGNLVFHEGCI